MKNVQIYYDAPGLNGGNRIDGQTADQAYRNVTDRNNNSIHTAKGRLTQQQFLDRCKKHDIVILWINVNGNEVYNNEKNAPIPKPGNNASKKIMQKFMYARFSSNCKETGYNIVKGEMMYYDKNEKSSYCKESNKFKGALLDKKYGHELAESKPIDESNPTIKPIDESKPVVDMIPNKVVETKPIIKPVTINPAPSKVNGHSDQGWKFMAAQIMPYMPKTKDIDIDMQAINERIDKAMENQTRRIEITINDHDPIKIDGQHMQFEKLFKLCAQRKNVLLVGPAGTGKTHAASEIAHALKLDYASISVNLATQKHEFFGYMDANGKYIETPFRQKFQNGGVFLLDEFDAGNANALTALNMATANGSVTFPDGNVTKHKDFIIIASANTFGLGANYEYVGRNKLDAATRNRFAKLTWNYDEKMELALSPNKEWTKYLQELRRKVSNLKLKDIIISIRQMIDGGHMLECMDRADVEEIYIWADVKPEDKRKLQA